jgi:hypothetical protein
LSWQGRSLDAVVQQHEERESSRSQLEKRAHGQGGVGRLKETDIPLPTRYILRAPI